VGGPGLNCAVVCVYAHARVGCGSGGWRVAPVQRALLVAVGCVSREAAGSTETDTQEAGGGGSFVAHDFGLAGSFGGSLERDRRKGKRYYDDDEGGGGGSVPPSLDFLAQPGTVVANLKVLCYELPVCERRACGEEGMEGIAWRGCVSFPLPRLSLGWCAEVRDCVCARACLVRVCARAHARYGGDGCQVDADGSVVVPVSKLYPAGGAVALTVFVCDGVFSACRTVPVALPEGGGGSGGSVGGGSGGSVGGGSGGTGGPYRSIALGRPLDPSLHLVQQQKVATLHDGQVLPIQLASDLKAGWRVCLLVCGGGRVGGVKLGGGRALVV
jgi:hypothetical protein